MTNRLAFGAVRFGLPYGIRSQAGEGSHSKSAAIIDHAWATGIDTLDTSIAYGDSEYPLGEI